MAGGTVREPTSPCCEKSDNGAACNYDVRWCSSQTVCNSSPADWDSVTRVPARIGGTAPKRSPALDPPMIVDLDGMDVKAPVPDSKVSLDRPARLQRRPVLLCLLLPLMINGVTAGELEKATVREAEMVEEADGGALAGPRVSPNGPAEAGTLPLELALVLDTSGSLSPAFAGIDAIGFLRTASKHFVTLFDDTKDSMALVQFASGRVVRFPLGNNFTVAITDAIDQFQAAGGTNTHDAIARANAEIEIPTAPESFRALVLATDGRPTAFRDIWSIGGGDVDGVIGGMQDPSSPPPMYLYDPFQVYRTLPYTTPPGWTTAQILTESWQRTLDAGDNARNDGITVFTIGLGNPVLGPLGQPDAALLVALANVESVEDPLNPGGMIVNSYFNPGQPRGGFFFAADATGLEEAFELAAQEITSRLASPPVPVELAGCSATASAEGILLEWDTTDLSDFRLFTVQRSQDGRDGHYVLLTDEPIEARKTGAGHYSYLDADVIAGTLYNYKLEAIDSGGGGVTFGPYPVVALGDRGEFRLEQNTPNPFSRAFGTTIHYSVPAPGSVEIRIVDPAGRLIRTLTQEATVGSNLLHWDGTDHNGKRVAGGVYFYKIKACGFSSARKMMVID